jgi:putative copper export protein
MFMSNAIISLSFFLHLLATVAWIGGLVTLALVVQPVLDRTVNDLPVRARLLEAMLKRFQPIANISLAVLILTGMVQTFTSRFYKGFLQFDNPWAQAILLKHVAVLGMIGVAAFITFSVQPALRRNALLIANGLADEAQTARLQQQQTRLTRINLVLSVLVLLFTAIASAQ